MGYQIRRSSDRGFANHNWLKSYHTFSFADYYDPKFMGFRDLRVMNEDQVAPMKGFPLHAHRDMEIISLVLAGQLAHQDSIDNEKIIEAGDIQVMTAGSGIKHSEYNPSKQVPVHFMQIWIQPDSKGLTPAYHQKKIPSAVNQWILLASKNGREESLPIHQDADILLVQLEANHRVEKELKGRYGWLQVLEGELILNGKDRIQTGDGVALDLGTELELKAEKTAQVCLLSLK